WDVFTGQELASLANAGPHGREVKCLAIGPDGTRVALAHQDGEGGKILVWSLETEPSGKTAGHPKPGENLLSRTFTLVRTLEGHTSPVVGVSFSRDGQHLATASSDQTLKLWDFKGGKEVKHWNIASNAWSVAFSPDGERLAVNGDSTLQVFEAATGKLLV